MTTTTCSVILRFFLALVLSPSSSCCVASFLVASFLVSSFLVASFFVAFPGLGYLFQEVHTLLWQLSLGLVRTSLGPVDLLKLWPVVELNWLCLDLAMPFPSLVAIFQFGSLDRTGSGLVLSSW